MRKNLPLIVGIALPILFIVIISIVVFSPSLFIKPKYNFIYTVNSDDNYNNVYRNTYKVEDNQLATQLLPLPTSPTVYTYQGDYPPIYEYDMMNNTSHEITLDEAKALMLDPGPSSPDGYTVGFEYSDDGIFGLFGGSGDDSGYFIMSNNAKKKLTGISAIYDSGSFDLIGWVK